jgi:hypothetical protein
MKCSQCNRPAVGQLGNGQPLCVEHYSMISAAMSEQQRNNMAMMNYYRDQIHETFGLPPPDARINIPRPIINQSPVTYNNISIDRSVVGAVNTAQVDRIDVAMDNIKNGGNDEINKAIKALTEAVIKSSELEGKERKQLVEELAFLAEQAALPKAERQKSVVGMVLKAMPLSFAVAADLTTLWAKWEPALAHFFK